METLQISPSILSWAANQSGLSLDALIDLLDKPSKREAIISGKLTVSDAEKLANKTHIPFGYFFLDTPPALEHRKLPDLRQIPNPQPLSTDFFEVQDDILRKQQWYLEYLQENGAQKLNFVGKYSFKDNLPPEKIAEDIQNSLGLSDQDRRKCKNYEEFYSLLSEKAESIGILVFKSGIVKSNTHRRLSADEFRGFAIADPLAPVIFINGKDSEAAWAFTLVHEIAHIWLGESGVSNLLVSEQINRNNLEAFCNRIAAEILAPKIQFLTAWEQTSEPKIDKISKEFKVSRLVIAIRAYTLGKIEWAILENLKKEGNKSKESGGDSYKTYPIRNSKRLTRAIVSEAVSGNLMLREAASLLNVKPDTVMELSKRVGIR